MSSWQDGKSMLERYLYLFQNSLYCDCEFLVGYEDGGEKEVS